MSDPTPVTDVELAEIRQAYATINDPTTPGSDALEASMRTYFAIPRLLDEIERLRSASVWDSEGLCTADPCTLPPGHDGECQR